MCKEYSETPFLLPLTIRDVHFTNSNMSDMLKDEGATQGKLTPRSSPSSSMASFTFNGSTSKKLEFKPSLQQWLMEVNDNIKKIRRVYIIGGTIGIIGYIVHSTVKYFCMQFSGLDLVPD